MITSLGRIAPIIFSSATSIAKNSPKASVGSGKGGSAILCSAVTDAADMVKKVGGAKTTRGMVDSDPELTHDFTLSV